MVVSNSLHRPDKDYKVSCKSEQSSKTANLVIPLSILQCGFFVTEPLSSARWPASFNCTCYSLPPEA